MINKTANDAVRAALEHSTSHKGEIGVQVAAYLKGELVIDCWAGVADQDTGRPVDGDTLFNIFSVTKAVPSTAIHIQAEKGLLGYDQPIASYWPEFGQNGKEDITVRDALNHTTGMPQMPPGTSPETICNWDYIVEGLAQLSPILPRGEPAYQSMSFGWILGEIVRRTDPARRDFETFIREEIWEPFDIPDFWVGISDEAVPRIATLVDDGSSGPAPEASLFYQSLPNNVRLIPEIFEQPDVRRACIAGVGGISSARSQARFWSILANRGELDGKRLLSAERVDAACMPRSGNALPDPVYFGAPMTLSQGGYWMHSATTSFTAPATGDRTICVPGAGASLGWADPDTGLAVAFCHNRMSRPKTPADHPLMDIADTVRKALGLA